jgi:hypothetical protein
VQFARYVCRKLLHATLRVRLVRVDVGSPYQLATIGRAIVSAYSWPPTNVVPVYVTVEGDEPLYCMRDLRPGRAGAGVINLPRGAEKVTIWWAPQPATPRWHGEASFIPWLRKWFGRRAPGQ